MAITAVTANIATGTSSSTFNHTATGNGNRLVLIMSGCEGEEHATDVSYGGYTLVAGDIIASVIDTGGAGNSQRLYAVQDSDVGASGSKVVDVTSGGPVFNVTVMEIYDASQTLPTGGAVDTSQSGSATSISSTATAPSGNSLGIGQGGHGNSGAATTASGTGTWNTISERAGDGQRVFTRYQNFSTSGNKTLTESWSGATRVAHILAIFAEETGGVPNQKWAFFGHNFGVVAPFLAAAAANANAVMRAPAPAGYERSEGGILLPSAA